VDRCGHLSRPQDREVEPLGRPLVRYFEGARYVEYPFLIAGGAFRAGEVQARLNGEATYQSIIVLSNLRPAELVRSPALRVR
jgi:hypothetical protein